MKIAHVFLLTLLYFSAPTGFSQADEPDKLDLLGNQDEVTQIEKSESKRLKTNLEAGTSFMYSPRNFYGPSYYISPNLSYLVTPRFTLSAGIGYQYTSLYPLYNLPEGGSPLLPMTRIFLYTRGSYLLTERLIITGSVYKTINDVPKLRYDPYPNYYNYQGVDLGIHYQINPNFSVGFHMQMNNLNYPSSGLIPPDALVPGF